MTLLQALSEPGAWRLVGAACVLIAYAGLCAAVFRGVRTKRMHEAHAAAVLHRAVQGQPAVLVAFASQTGFAEQLACQSAKLLNTGGVPVRLLAIGELSADELASTERALFIVSTYGEGDAPDAAARFTQHCMATGVPLPRLHHAVLALGDRGYANFCGFGRRVDAWLQAQGATPMFARIDVDNDDAPALQAWQQQVGRLAGTSDLPDWQSPAFERWRFVDRRVLNAGSAGAPVCHLELEPAAGAALPEWEAGDLVQLLAPADRGRHREYTIASLPSDGRVHLLVRQERRADGRLGCASGWLTEQAGLGETIELRLRARKNFRIGENAARPLVLIGNGTGFAGMRSHLKARAASTPRRPCWLLFGERQAAHDHYFADEVQAWLEHGVLADVDLVFSRDQPERRYVQHRLFERAQQLREWVRGGAALYVCGSLKGMASGVDAALTDILGTELLGQLADAGRYRRDVY